MELWPVIPIAGIGAMLFALWLAQDVLKRDKGTASMQEVGNRIYEGAQAFLFRQYRTIGMLAIVTAVVIGVIVGIFSEDSEEGVLTGIAFIAGALCSAVAGFIGMYIAVQANVRTASAAQRSLAEAVTVSLRGGAVSGFLVVALSLIGVSAMYIIYKELLGKDIEETPFLIVGFGFGASFVALFAQLGGGIYTKAADVGADLVGKVEAGIPEDDPRNPAVIADLVGDNVGDCAGRGADLFESMSAENIGAMILGVAIFKATGDEEWILFPLVIRSFGVLATLLGMVSIPFFARGSNRDAMTTLNYGYYLVSILSVAFMALVTSIMLDEWHLFFLAGVIGIVVGIAVVFLTQYYTSGSWRPVQEIAEASRTGPATNVISGTAVGLETTFATAVVIGLALASAFFLGQESGLPNGGVYGTAVATMGMLMSAAYILAMDTFGPITDNAGGITEMSDAPAEARAITDRLDAVGNTTKALTKGYAVVSAGLAAFLLFSAFLDEVREELPIEDLRALNVIDVAALANLGVNIDDVEDHDELNELEERSFAETGDSLFESLPVNLSNVETFVGGLLGAMLVFLFSSLAIRAVGNTAGSIIEEVRRQFRENPGIMDGSVRPDYGRAVDITAAAALRQMIAPGILAVGLPIVVGVIFLVTRGGNAGWESVAGLLIVGTITGIMMATFFNNSGGAWDNAKKFIESGEMKDPDGTVVGKGSPTHAAAVIGDTVGDPFKDTAGPSLHVLVKLLSTVTLVLAPLFI
ncbi:MAG: sodium-translocating pyrophosphatase [Dehalococcoidia bacterium]|nr:sodium-translocating pyrophosphatase [Dehalococcoidia bacterium]